MKFIRCRLAAAFVIAALFSIGRAQTQPPALPPLEAKAAKALESTWKRLESRSPDIGARGLYEFLLTAVAHDWRPEIWPAAIELGEELHDRDPASPTYGNYRWYWREPKPNDRNAVEFSMQSASLTWVLYRDRVPKAARERLTESLALGVEGMLRHKVDVSYTNIFLMRLANCILIGESTGRPDLVQQARAWFDEWFAYTRVNGVHEFSSPTYYGTDLVDLGALANYARTPAVREQATRALRLFWTDIALNWFAPYQGIAGAHSRDYGFLTGHGYLDQQLVRAGWLEGKSVGEAHPALDDLTFWAPPKELRDFILNPVPRVVSQRWGAQPWERATHYVGHDFSLGSSGAGYHAQDKVLALTLGGGPQMPIVNFSLDYRRDPYGQTKLGTADGHAKLTHLLPFIASVQRGPEVLLLAAYDPAHARNPAGGKAAIDYAGVDANFILPATAGLFAANAPLAPDDAVSLAPHSPLFLRCGKTAAAIQFVATRNDAGDAAPIAVVRDGAAVNAQRLTAVLAKGTPRQRVVVVAWVRAAENITTDEAFDAFRRKFLRDAEHVHVSSAKAFEVTVPGMIAPLQITADLEHEKRLAMEGADPAADAGILAVNGRDVGGPLLIAKQEQPANHENGRE